MTDKHPAPPGRPPGPLKRGRGIRLPKDLDEALDIYSRVTKTPVSTIIENLVRSWASQNQTIIAKGRELVGLANDGAASRRKRK